MWNPILLPAILLALATAAPLHKRDVSPNPNPPSPPPPNKRKNHQTDTDPSRCSNFCAGTNSTDDPNLYICGDPRLGPVTLPTSLPLASLAGNSSSYHRFGGLCPGAFLAAYTSSSGAFVYPTQNGFALSTAGAPIAANTTLERGTLLDRFGSEYGTFMSPAGAPYAQRALPPTNLDAAPGSAYPYNYHVYEVLRPFIVLAGPIAPWFGQMGMGVQFQLTVSVGTLVDQGILGRVNLTGDPNY
jgi:Tuberculosis necrotizing toxin